MRKNVVQMKQIVEKMNLKNLTPDVELSDKAVEVPDINRPALQLTGFFERFDAERELKINLLCFVMFLQITYCRIWTLNIYMKLHLQWKKNIWLR